MRFLTSIVALAAVAFSGGCIDFPVDDWERGHSHSHGPGVKRTRTYRAPGYSERETESVEAIPGTAPTTGTTNIYYGSYYPNGYAQPVYVVPAYPAYGYGSPYYGRGGSYYNVNASGTYKGVNYNVGYGSGGYGYGYGYGYGAGAYGTASGTKGNTSWSASYGYPYGSGYGGRQSYGIYGNGNNGNQGGNTTPSRFSTYR